MQRNRGGEETKQQKRGLTGPKAAPARCRAGAAAQRGVGAPSSARRPPAAPGPGPPARRQPGPLPDGLTGSATSSRRTGRCQRWGIVAGLRLGSLARRERRRREGRGWAESRGPTARGDLDVLRAGRPVREGNRFPPPKHQPNKIILYAKNFFVLGVGGAAGQEFEVFKEDRRFSPILPRSFPFSTNCFHGLSLNSSSYNNSTHTSSRSPLQKSRYKFITKKLWKCMLNHRDSTLQQPSARNTVRPQYGNFCY